MNLKKINNPFGGLTYYKESTTSTMAEAMEIIEEKRGDGALFISDYQTDGIGRIPGRKWLSSANDNLTFTLVLKKDFIGHGFGTIPLKAGLALSNIVSDLTGKTALIKWPNDVIVENKKISGILCRSQKGYILIGIGINVNQMQFDKSLDESATSLSLLTNNGFNLEMVLSKFLEAFYDIIKSDSWLDELNKNLYKVNEEVIFSVGNPENKNLVTGELIGLDEQGKVLIKDRLGDVKGYLSGEFVK